MSLGGRYVNSVANVLGRDLGVVGGVRDRHPVVSWNEDGPAAMFLARIAEEREWWAQAACRGAGTADFFPEGKGGDTNKIVATARAKWCSRCPVADLCRAKGEHEHGVWGGTSERERQRARRDASGITCDECGHPCATLGVLRKHVDRFHKEAAA